MPVDLSSVGVPSAPAERSWDSKDCLLYAVGVGAGAADPAAELEFTTENSRGVTQRVLPTMAVVLPAGGLDMRAFGDIDLTKALHGTQSIELHREIPVSGRLRTVHTITAIYDKGSAAVGELETRCTLADTDEALFTNRMTLFMRGEGGFGGERGPSAAGAAPPDRAPDHEVTYQTRPEQPLLYRLNGDRNPLHSDPDFARRGGFDRPILHGLCTYGFTGRALLHAVCGGDPARFKRMDARFTSPVMPGETLTVKIWRSDSVSCVFLTEAAGGRVVLDSGVLVHT
ncbi:MAG: MaoC/PaaZ C-terminal domain-containing protein [Acidimicrobiales bacterium]